MGISGVVRTVGLDVCNTHETNLLLCFCFYFYFSTF